MAEKKLRFAIFGNGSKALESIQIWEMLDYLIKHSAEVYVEQSFYYALQHQHYLQLSEKYHHHQGR